MNELKPAEPIDPSTEMKHAAHDLFKLLLDMTQAVEMTACELQEPGGPAHIESVSRRLTALSIEGKTTLDEHAATVRVNAFDFPWNNATAPGRS